MIVQLSAGKCIASIHRILYPKRSRFQCCIPGGAAYHHHKFAFIYFECHVYVVRREKRGGEIKSRFFVFSSLQCYVAEASQLFHSTCDFADGMLQVEFSVLSAEQGDVRLLIRFFLQASAYILSLIARIYKHFFCQQNETFS